MSESPTSTSLDLTPAEIVNERMLIDGLFLGAVAFGIHLTLFIWCFSHIIQKRKTRFEYFTLVYICLLFLMGNIGNGTNIKVGEMSFVDHRNDYPGGPGQYTAMTGGGKLGLVTNIVYVINSWFQDGLLVYRFCVFYSQQSRLWLVLPCLMYLTVIALSLMLIVMLCVPGITIWSTISVNFGVAYWSVSVALNVLLTACIAFKLLHMRYQLRKLNIGNGKEYMTITSMLVESAALYTANGLIFIVSYGLKSPVQHLALPVLGQTQSIAPLLIILRVIEGRAWTASTVANFTGGRDSEDLRFEKNTGTTLEFARVTMKSNQTKDSTLNEVVDTRTSSRD